jgi:hypothetical protein
LFLFCGIKKICKKFFQVSYTIAGAFIFRYVEKRHQDQLRLDVLRIRNETVSKFWNKTLEMNTFAEADYKKLVVDELLLYQKRMVKFIQRGYDGAVESYSEKWSFAGAFLYSLTVITTIGKCRRIISTALV